MLLLTACAQPKLQPRGRESSASSEAAEKAAAESTSQPGEKQKPSADASSDAGEQLADSDSDSDSDSDAGRPKPGRATADMNAAGAPGDDKLPASSAGGAGGSGAKASDKGDDDVDGKAATNGTAGAGVDKEPEPPASGAGGAGGGAGGKDGPAPPRATGIEGYWLGDLVDRGLGMQMVEFMGCVKVTQTQSVGFAGTVTYIATDSTCTTQLRFESEADGVYRFGTSGVDRSCPAGKLDLQLSTDDELTFEWYLGETTLLETVGTLHRVDQCP